MAPTASIQNATLCGDPACVSRPWNKGKVAFPEFRMQPSAEIVRVEGAECRWSCVSEARCATFCGHRACRRRGMQVELLIFVCLEDWVRTWLMFIVFLARNAGKVFLFLRSLMEKVRFGRLHGQFLRKSRGKRLFWKASFTVFVKVLRERSFSKASFSQFFWKSRGKHSFWKA